MSGPADPWDAMVQSDDSDQEYTHTGADGIDDEDQDFELQDDDYDYDRDTDDDDASDDNELGNLGNIVLSPCTPPFFRVTSAEHGTVRSTKASNSETMESRMLRLWPHCRNLSPMERAEDQSGSYKDPAKYSSGSKRNQRTRMRTTTFICPIGALRTTSNAPEVIGTRKSPSPNLLA